MAKFTLDITDEYPYTLLGINTSLKGYRLAWNLNRNLNLRLQREDPIEAFNKLKEKVNFSFYSFIEENRNTVYRLIENRSGGNFFIPEQPRCDYLLIIDRPSEQGSNEMLKIIRGISSVSMAFEIQIESLKSKQNILLTI
ncbi:MAG: IPExxxVDY family protein [Cryomorphaceae bacterium]|nr:IPExxxVDY family protein [Flavobacteriales bacterium]